jgi:predicted dienelactone hydrolase
MRTFEILILIALAPLIVGLASRPLRRSALLRPLAWTALVLALLHLFIEGYRWQMIPAYLLIVSACLRTRKARDEPAQTSRRRQALRLALGVLEMLAWTVALVLAVGNPVFHYPMPTGSYSVGTTRLYFSDLSRQDPFAPNPRTPRELLVVAWYPADVTAGAQTERFWPDAPASIPAIEKVFHLPPFNFLQHLRLVRSHSYPNASVTRGRYPVLIFSHGYLSTPWQNTVQMEELASHGFIVFSIGHTYESAAIPFPGGRIACVNQARMKAAGGDRSQLKEFIAQSLDVWVADTRYVLDELTRIDAEPATRFSHCLDLTRLGVFGMSFGGATAGEFCAQDRRCRAGMNMDGFQHGTLSERPLAVPFLYFAAGVGTHENDPIYAGSQNDFYTVQVRHAAHSNFSDANLVVPILKYAGLLGAVDSRQMESILNAYTLAFFQQYLQGRQSDLLDGPPSADRYPEVVFRARKAPAPLFTPSIQPVHLLPFARYRQDP